MGDRGNIVVINKKYGSDDYDGVWLYSHWGGSRLEKTARKAVERSGRVGDPSYLTRIIFCSMLADQFGETGKEIFDREIAKDEPDTGFLVQLAEELFSSTGFGIGTGGAGDQEHPTVCVDADTGEIWLDVSYPTETDEVVENKRKVA
jgi:hypothetical protein